MGDPPQSPEPVAAPPSEPNAWTAGERALAIVAVVLIAAIVGAGAWFVFGSSPGEPGVADTTMSPRPSLVPSRGPSPPSPATPTVDPTAAPDDFDASALSDVTSYRFRVELEGSGIDSPLTPIEGTIVVRGTVISDPEEALDITIENIVGPGSAIRFVLVGDAAWVDDGSGTFHRAEGAELESARRAAERYRAENLFGQTVGELPSDAERLGRGTLHGMPVTEYRILPSVTEEGPMAGILVEGRFAIHRELRIPIRTEVTFTTAGQPAGSFRILLEVLSINDPADRVIPPI